MNLTRGVAGLLVASGLALSAPAVSGAAVSIDCAQGRSLLQCGEKAAIYNAAANWSYRAVLDLTLFETRLPLHLNNPALAQFWRFESATAMARYVFEFAILNQLTDRDYEQIAPRATLPAPVVRPSGVVDRRTAAAMSKLLLAEQQEVVNLNAMDTALNRATAALIEGRRSDWVAWQESAAAGFAYHAAAALGRVVSSQAAVTQALVDKHLLFGIGPVDLRVAQRRVRAHGFVGSVGRIMSTLGMTPLLLAYAQSAFVSGSLGPTSYSLSRYLSSAAAFDRQCERALKHFAARVPPAGRPPS